MMKCFSKIIVVLMMSAVIFSCGNGKPKDEKRPVGAILAPEKDGTDTTGLSAESDHSLAGDSSEQIIPYRIRYDLFQKRNLSLASPFSPDSALKALYPGHYYKLPTPGDDTVALEAWSCPTCKQKKFNGWYDEEFVTFPLKDSNETRFKDTVQFTDDNGNRNIFISFSSTEFTTDLIGTGRFACASFGLALFTEEKGKWNLEVFSPALGCYGSYQSIPIIHLLKYGKNNFGCYLKNINGGAGGPYYADLYGFAIVDNEFKLIYTESGTARQYDGKSEWDSKFISTENKKGFSELVLETTGRYEEASFEEDDTANTPTAIKQLIKTNKKFDFKINRHYSFENGRYVFKNEGLSTGAAKN